MQAGSKTKPSTASLGKMRRRRTAGGPPSGLGRGSPANCSMEAVPAAFPRPKAISPYNLGGNSENPQITNNGKESQCVRSSQNLTFRVSAKGGHTTLGGWRPRDMPTVGDGGTS